MKVVKIDLKKIEQNENSRVTYKVADLSELMASMRKDGLLQPVGVMELPGGKYDAVFGNRRIVAAKKLGWTTIDAHVVPAQDDVERDVLGLVENFKRQNTTVAEDGRIFQKLKDSGLSIKEIAIRVGTTEARINHALDIYNDFPKEFKTQIVNSGGSRKKNENQMQASIAFAINNIRRTHGLGRTQTRSLLNHAKSKDLRLTQVNEIAPLMAAGHDLQEAIGMAGKIVTLNLHVSISKEHMEKLEKKTRKTIQVLCYEALEKDSTLKVHRRKSDYSRLQALRPNSDYTKSELNL